MLPPALQRLLDEMDACERDARAIVEGLSDESINWQPDGGRAWSVGQCLDHLRIMNHFYVATFVPLAERAQADGVGAFEGLHPTWFGRWFARSWEPPVTRRFRAPQQVIPASTVRKDEVLEGYVQSHEPYRGLVHTCAPIAVDKVVGPTRSSDGSPCDCQRCSWSSPPTIDDTCGRRARSRTSCSRRTRRPISHESAKGTKNSVSWWASCRAATYDTKPAKTRFE